MERNTILAVVASVFILFTYQAVFVAPNHAKKLQNSKEMISASPAQNLTNQDSSLVSSISKPTTKSIEARNIVINTDGYSVSVSDVGGSLHNIAISGKKHALPLVDVLSIQGTEANKFDINKVNDKQIIANLKTSSLEIIKTFDFNSNSINFRMEIKQSQSGNAADVRIKPYAIKFSSLETLDQREAILDEYSNKIDGKVFRKGSAPKFSPKETKQIVGSAQWVAFRDHYDAVIFKPSFESKAIENKQLSEKELDVTLTVSADKVIYEGIVYIGPQDKWRIASIDKSIVDVVAFSSFLPIEWISQAIYYLVPALQAIFKNWGVCIILVGALIYGMTYPLTVKSMLSMRKMQQMQPKINALKDRFKDEPQRLNTEIMEIYKREKINPLGGCLPMLLQMPFFMAIYQVLWRAYYFQGQSFLWIKDLSQADRLFTLPFVIPFLNTSNFNILPLIMGAVMFWQQKLTAKAAVVTDETQAMQQKIMTIFFPIFITFIFYNFSSSLSLYFTMFYLFSALTQWKMSNAK